MTVFFTQLDSSSISPLPSNLSRDLDHLLRSFLYKACKDPRDKVYGILGLVDQSKYPVLKIDYFLDTKAVYTNAMTAILLEAGGDLCCLTGPGFASTGYDLPSWVRNFGVTPALTATNQELKRLQSYYLYNTSAPARHSPIVLDNNLLCLRGTYIDKIFRIGKGVQGRGWQAIYKAILDWAVLAEIEIPVDVSREYFYEPKVNDFWRTIVGDRLFESDELLRRMDEADLDSLRLWLPKMLTAFKQGKEPPLEAWQRTMCSFISGRVMFLTEGGNLGLCYPNCEPGDEVWALDGGRVPFVLRRNVNPHEGAMQDKHRYKFMGESYSHGSMDAEILVDRFSQTAELILL